MGVVGGWNEMMLLMCSLLIVVGDERMRVLIGVVVFIDGVVMMN